ncbi:MAG: hypothetical protein IT495_15930 [Gammaproteobacteria bacterium]|nr:hypothetical protein [Gammaproteobacteria bacterium]
MIAIAGAGCMDRGIRLAFVRAGHRVVLIDREERDENACPALAATTRDELGSGSALFTDSVALTSAQAAALGPRIEVRPRAAIQAMVPAAATVRR